MQTVVFPVILIIMLVISKHDIIVILRESHFRFGTAIKDIWAATHEVIQFESILRELVGQ